MQYNQEPFITTLLTLVGENLGCIGTNEILFFMLETLIKKETVVEYEFIWDGFLSKCNKEVHKENYNKIF